MVIFHISYNDALKKRIAIYYWLIDKLSNRIQRGFVAHLSIRSGKCCYIITTIHFHKFNTIS